MEGRENWVAVETRKVCAEHLVEVPMLFGRAVIQHGLLPRRSLEQVDRHIEGIEAESRQLLVEIVEAKLHLALGILQLFDYRRNHAYSCARAAPSLLVTSQVDLDKVRRQRTTGWCRCSAATRRSALDDRMPSLELSLPSERRWW